MDWEEKLRVLPWLLPVDTLPVLLVVSPFPAELSPFPIVSPFPGATFPDEDRVAPRMVTPLEEVDDFVVADVVVAEAVEE